jgi:Na+-transporting NADH:ubiquinone oxidoreductase subunit C
MAKTFSNAYIFLFALIMVLIVAIVLSVAFAYLKPRQDANRRTEKIMNLLQAAGIPVTKDNADDLYNSHLLAEVMLDPVTGERLSVYLSDGTFGQGDQRAFDVDMQKQVYAQRLYREGRSTVNPPLPLFKMRGTDGDTLYIIPLFGRGLWGPVWGNIAVGTDRNTIKGATFDHKSETPGLGAEINQPFFMDTFVGKRLFDDRGTFTSVKVVKGGVSTLPDDRRIHGVDAISGGTITSDGVTEMLYDCLINYEPFFKKAL